ncbi:hypothetical protein SBW85_19800 [Vibrio plantisponsor]|uniref:Uncharacterized protein n=1 Tax=Vibrio plantisponsor TaxID=664643 RepID=A0ABU4IMZ8_9VIBR|nr:hypothetical protein [Vibrio plantisponsor]MDW6019953.1 hypothetical protein [Vibrio plantisponsor]NNM42650.1 hypothetical protein [Vibrio plantisponsor]
MKNVQVTTSELKQFAAKVYANGKTPGERFGMSWEMLSDLEEKNPQLTCKQGSDCHNNKVA